MCSNRNDDLSPEEIAEARRRSWSKIPYYTTQWAIMMVWNHCVLLALDWVMGAAFFLYILTRPVVVIFLMATGSLMAIEVWDQTIFRNYDRSVVRTPFPAFVLVLANATIILLLQAVIRTLWQI